MVRLVVTECLICEFRLQDVLLPGSRVVSSTLCNVNEHRKCDVNRYKDDKITVR